MQPQWRCQSCMFPLPFGALHWVTKMLVVLRAWTCDVVFISSSAMSEAITRKVPRVNNAKNLCG